MACIHNPGEGRDFSRPGDTERDFPASQGPSLRWGFGMIAFGNHASRDKSESECTT